MQKLCLTEEIVGPFWMNQTFTAPPALYLKICWKIYLEYTADVTGGSPIHCDDEGSCLMFPSERNPLFFTYLC